MIDIHEATLGWARARMLIQNGRVTTQALKLGSEMSELALNLLLHEDVKDDIGDMLVVMTILAALQDDNLLTIISGTKIKTSTKHVPFPLMVHYVGELQDKAIKGKNLSDDIAQIVNQLERIASAKGTTLLECWEEAYEDIKDRKGFLNGEGCFIKESDEEYQLMLREGWIEE